MVENTSKNLGAQEKSSVLSWGKISIWVTILLLVNYYTIHSNTVRHPVLSSILFFLTVLAVFYLIGLIISLTVWRRLPRAKGLLIALSIFCVMHIALITTLSTNRQKNYDYPLSENFANTTGRDSQIINHESSGNLQSKYKVGCIPISSAKNEFTPADLYIGVTDCIDKKQINSAANLYILAQAYGTFDTLRVSDKSAHQALSILQLEFLKPLTKEDKTELAQVLRRTNLAKDEITKICKQIRQLGPPSYHPDYMIQHGMGAFTRGQSNGGIAADFNQDKSWEKALSTSIHCSKIL